MWLFFMDILATVLVLSISMMLFKTIDLTYQNEEYNIDTIDNYNQ